LLVDGQVPTGLEDFEVLLRVGFASEWIDGRVLRLGSLGSGGLTTLHACQDRVWGCFIVIAIALLVHVGEIRVVHVVAIALLRLFSRYFVCVCAGSLASPGFTGLGHFDNDDGGLSVERHG
jgi:hypothetical protein